MNRDHIDLCSGIGGFPLGFSIILPPFINLNPGLAPKKQAV